MVNCWIFSELESCEMEKSEMTNLLNIELVFQL
jgi:hypothetical protein